MTTTPALGPGVEIGLVTTNLDAMVEFYSTFLGLPHQMDLPFPGGSMKRYQVGGNVIKLVSYDEAPAAKGIPGGGAGAEGIRYFTLFCDDLRAFGERVDASAYDWALPVTEFPGVPGMGFCFVIDPDGNHVEFVGGC